MIVHKLDHRSSVTPRLSTRLTPKSPDALEFVSQHIVTSREHHRSRQAKFLDTGTNEFMQAADAIFGAPTDTDAFVRHSSTIARILFDIMHTNRSISPGDLVVGLFDDDTSGAEPELAVLKLDPQDGFRGILNDDGEDIQVVLVNAGDVLPRTDIQKSALVLPPALRSTASHDLVVLDQQTGRYSTSLSIASFFLDRFLHCQFDFNAADLTRRVVNETARAVGEKVAPGGKLGA